MVHAETRRSVPTPSVVQGQVVENSRGRGPPRNSRARLPHGALVGELDDVGAEHLLVAAARARVHDRAVRALERVYERLVLLVSRLSWLVSTAELQ